MKMLLGCGLIAFSALAAEAGSVATDMTAAANALLKTLNDGQKQQAMLAFDDAAREDFRYTPRDRKGLMIKGLEKTQLEAVTGLLKSALSEKGVLKAQQIRALEGILAEMEKRPDYRDPDKYWISIFGTPGDPKAWGWRFEGHHLSLNYTLTGEKVAVTPSFFGANPAEVRVGFLTGHRVLAAEEDLARALVVQLVAAGHQEVIFTDQPPAEILSREESRVKPLAQVGLSAAGMSEGQREALVKLVRVYLDRHRSEMVEADWKAISDAGVDKIHFGWAGGIKRGDAWYYRIQGPTFLMEAANSQNQANHTHATWRKFDGDFGRDLLGEHYRDHAH